MFMTRDQSLFRFQTPNAIDNNAWGITLTGAFSLGPDVSMDAEAYYGALRRAVENGNTANDTPCNDGSGLLCVTAATAPPPAGRPSPPSSAPVRSLTPNWTGSSPRPAPMARPAQAVSTARLFGLSDHGVVGASFDGAATSFGAVSSIGGLTPVSRVFVGPGVVIDEPGNNVPVSVAVTDADGAVFFTDTLDLTSRLSATASARSTTTSRSTCTTGLGGDLTGDHHYSRLNPAIGAAYRVTPWLTAYAGYSQANRAPTPAELSCAGPSDSCSLANFFVGDPNLKQVIAHTLEAGLRGRAPGPLDGTPLSLQPRPSITAISPQHRLHQQRRTLGRAYFTNIGGTRPPGPGTAEVRFKDTRWSGYLAWSHPEATYRLSFVEIGRLEPRRRRQRQPDHHPGRPPARRARDQVKLGVSRAARPTGSPLAPSGGGAERQLICSAMKRTGRRNCPASSC